MEKEFCMICQKSENQLIEFSCSHLFCHNCIHKVVLYNQDSIIEDINKIKTINLNCNQCNQGNYLTTKEDLLKLITDKSAMATYAHIHCPQHKDKTIQFICMKCNTKLCQLCLNEHLSNYPDHMVTGIINECRTLCGIHFLDNKKYKYKCLTCGNINICQMCLNESHNNHAVRSIRLYDADNLEKMRKEFLWENETEIEGFVNVQFDKIKNRLNENEYRVIGLCDEIIELLNNMKTVCIDKYKQLDDELELTRELLKISYLKYYKELQNKCSGTNYSSVSFTNDQDYFVQKFKFKDDVLDSLNKIKFDITKEKLLFKEKELCNITKDASKYSCSKVIQGHTNSIFTLLQLLDGRLLSGSGDNTIRLWDINDEFNLLKTLTGHVNYVNSLIQLKSGKVASGSADHTIRVWDTFNDFKCIKIIKVHNGPVKSLLQLHEGSIVSGSDDKTIRVYDPESGFTCIKILTGHTDKVNCLTQLKNGCIISGSTDSTIRIWDPELDYECVKILQQHSYWVSCIIQLSDNKIASCSGDKTIKLWNYEGGNNFSFSQDIQDHTHGVNSIIQLKDGKIASASSDKTIRITDVNMFGCHNGKVLHGHSKWVSYLLQLKDGRIVSGSGDNTLRVWSL
jgi:WD40 repeat protein